MTASAYIDARLGKDGNDNEIAVSIGRDGDMPLYVLHPDAPAGAEDWPLYWTNIDILDGGLPAWARKIVRIPKND